MRVDRTAHAEQRHQARATLSLWESLVLDFGTRVRANGADLVFLDKAALKRIGRELGGRRALRLFERWFHQYLVVNGDGQVITTGFRTCRIKRA